MHLTFLMSEEGIVKSDRYQIIFVYTLKASEYLLELTVIDRL